VRELEQRLEVGDVRVDASLGDETGEMNVAAALARA